MSEADKEKRVVVTADELMKKAGRKIDPVDASVLTAAATGEGLVKITSAEMLRALGEAAARTSEMFKSEIRERMTAERAYRIRELRVTEGYSWRALASQSADDWGDDATWEPKSNQLAGMALCEIAAASMGEDYMQEPWN